jgi:glycosyltransferase involved in cell wall biosynthesis
MTLRVLHVTRTILWGGVPLFVKNCALAQLDRSFDVAVACPEESDLPVELDRVGIPRLLWSARRDPGPSSLWEAFTLKRLISRWRPDVVHLHSSKAGLAGRLLRHRGRAVVFQPHAWSFEHVGGAVGGAALRWERIGAGRCDAVICVSDAERRRGLEAGIRGDLRVIPNGVRLDDWTPATGEDRAAARATLGLPDGPVVVCVGRLTEQKGQDVLLRAWASIRDRVPDAHLALVGEGPLRDALAGLAGPGVALVGGRDDVPLWMAAADVIALPSRWEGMSLTMLEAMARGRSVIATDVAGVREAMGETDAVVPPENERALADAVVTRLRDPGATEAEGRRLRARIEERFSFARTEESLTALYSELLERQPKS